MLGDVAQNAGNANEPPTASASETNNLTKGAEPTTGYGQGETGTDSTQTDATQYENPVYAARDGRVFRKDWQNPEDPNSGLGYRVSIENAEGYDQYGHMDPDQMAVGVGDFVRAGDLIGSYANPTNGSSNGPHVHFERRLWSDPSVTVNPGNISPLGPGGIQTARYGQTDRVHTTAHQGSDWAYPRR